MKKAMLGLLAIMLMATFAPTVAAADDWKFAVTPYLWGAGINGTATVGSHEADVSKSFDDILKDLDFAFMVNLQARKGRFGLYSDVLFLGVSDTTPVTGPRGATLLEATTSLDTWIVDLGASWEVTRWAGSGEGQAGFVDLIAGGRYWNLDTEIKAENPFFAGERSVGKTMDWFDPILGARFTAGLTPKLSLIGRGDVGGFDLGSGSKLTWSASAYLGWRFSPLVSAWAGYKHLFVEREDDKGTSVDLAMSGPVFGVAFTF
jgi:hypothetical protein